MSKPKLKLQGLRTGDTGQEAVREGATRPGLPPERVYLDFLPTQPLGPGHVSITIRFPPEGVVDVLCRFQLSDGSDHFVELPRVGRNHYAGIVLLPSALSSVTLEACGSGAPLCPTEIVLTPATGLRRVWPVLNRVARAAVRELSRLAGNRLGAGAYESMRSRRDYRIWRTRFDERPDVDQDLHRARALRLGQGPVISLIMTVGLDDEWGVETLRSLKAQFYARWELIILTRAPTTRPTQGLLQDAACDGRITMRAISGSYASACNEALRFARGEFIGVIPAGALLPSHALTEIAYAVERHPGVEVLYADEDRLDIKGRRSAPRFKPGWSPDYLDSYDYVGDPTLYRSETLRRSGGWRSLDGVEDYDVKLRVTKAVSSVPSAVLHLPKVLIHVPERATDSASGPDTGLPVNADYIRGNAGGGDESLSVRRPRPDKGEVQPRVSIIIPTRDQAALLSTCVRSLLEKTDYASYEIIIVDNGSREAETMQAFAELSRDERVSILEYPHPFNYSALNNHAVRHARGTVLALLNNDVEVVSPGWLSEMAAHASRPDIGCVGAKLLYPDGTVQHGGILLGVAGLAGHAHRHAPPSAAGYLQRLQSVLNVSAVTAACLVVRRSVFDEVGGMDEVGLATAFNDVDFCLKVRAAGYLNLWTPKAVLIHHESKSRGYERTPAKRERLAREEDVMRRRWGRILLEDPYYSPHLTRVTENFRIRRT